jgi:hypothetical protein
MISDLQKEKIAIQVIRTLYAQFEKFPGDISKNRNAPFHEAFLKAFAEKLEGKVSSIPVFISLSSWMHGLNTSLGQSFFEKTAYILSNSKKKDFKGNKISEGQVTEVSRIITNLKNRVNEPNLQTENERIWLADSGEETDAHDFTIDIFWEDETEVVGIEAKTVRPNSDVSKETKDKILRAKCVLKKLYPGKNIKFFYGFPFDPFGLNPTTSDKSEFMNKNVNFSKYFAEDEVLLASEFWDYISGSANTMETILEIINAVATTDFPSKLDFLRNKTNAETFREEYLSLLSLWQLNREKALIENESLIRQQIQGNRALTRIYNQDIFIKGDYNENRISQLLDLIITT